ncbi:hypothetical protein PRUPE_2G029800 [Prunus persica]|uniref:Uncharacterized protein n=1 Tax=Prunus persica TaxID=3760 RepID=A0A251QBA9_PRUPE|nr:hypothetical protein PRUPE_2G029800 [Prunus persica]
MASLQPSWLSSLNSISSTTKPTLFPSTNLNKPHPLKPFKLSFSLNPPNSESSQPNSPNSPETTPEAQPGPTDPVKLALENAKAYKKSVQMNKKLKIEKNPVKDGDGIAGNGESGPDGAGGGKKEVPAAVKIAMEKAKEYKKSKGIVGGDINAGESDKISGLEESNGGNLGNEIVDKKGKLSVSSIDFVGLGFADKKEGRGLPAGLVPIADYFPEGNSPDVEIIVGDARNFDAVARKPEQTQGDNSDLYKPKVSSWGVFPRPNDISKTFGGGRVIQPGEVLETAEEKAAKEARTRQLVAAYKSKMGMNIDPKLRSECEKALKDGDTLMDVGELKEALIYYEQVMDKLPFKEAQVMYEKLQSHPTAKVSKKARQFVFSFQAMEMMKLTGSSPWKNTGFQNYFEAFIENKSDYVLKEAESEVGTLSQTLPYIIFLVSPIFVVLLIALQKRI